MLKKALEMGNSLYKGSHWGTWNEFDFQDFWETDGGVWKQNISY